MASQEKILLDGILLEAAKLSGQVILFRNNTGLGWQGDIVSQSSTHIVIKNPRPLHAGLIVGSSDLIGYTSIEITPEMVGKTIAVFTAVEGKTINKRKKKTSTSSKQKHFLQKVNDAGGIGIEANDDKQCITEIKRAIDEYKKN